MGANCVSTIFKRGINLAGAEFPCDHMPGKLDEDYTFNDEATFRYFSNQGFHIIRVPILWERLQPTLSGPFVDEYLAKLVENIAWAKKCGSKVIIDVHNYGRFNGEIIDVGAPRTSDFVDLWLRLSHHFKDESGIYAYGLMNEPHDMETASWKAISQAAVAAIRQNNDHQLIMVPGDEWESAKDWRKNNPVPWITDPDNHVIYEAHCYFDYDCSGVYRKTFDEELAANPNLNNIGPERVRPFIDWCAEFQGFLGEFGLPNTDLRWLNVLDNFMQALDKADMGSAYWAAGIRWGDYALAIQPRNNYTDHALQMAILTRRQPPEAFSD